MPEPRISRLETMARAGHGWQQVASLVRDPDPAPTHAYERSRHSGAGNCVCGAAERHRRHPHEFLAADSAPALCVCALPPKARCHNA